MQIKSDTGTGCTISSSVYFSDDSYGEGTITVEIEPSDKNYILQKQKLSLLDASSEEIKCGEIDTRFDSIRKDIKNMPLSLTRAVILKRKSKFLPNDELSLLCKCTFSTGIELEKIEETCHDLPMANHKLSCKSSSSKIDHIASENLSACPSALDDFTDFFNNHILTDVNLKTETKSFPAHVFVLCSRSSVFKAMLTNDMREKNSACIQIDDLENDTVHQLLLFLYSDELENLKWESAIKLCYAGDKYAIEKLKVLCSSFLMDNISTAYASELLLLADTHNDSELKNFVEDFILDHEDDVFGSDEWEKLIETNPQLVIKTMHLKYKRRKSGK